MICNVQLICDSQGVLPHLAHEAANLLEQAVDAGLVARLEQRGDGLARGGGRVGGEQHDGSGRLLCNTGAERRLAQARPNMATLPLRCMPSGGMRQHSPLPASQHRLTSVAMERLGSAISDSMSMLQLVTAMGWDMATWG